MTTDVEEIYRGEHSAEVAQRLSEAGVTLFITHYYKMGLKEEAGDIAHARELARECRMRGIRVGVYIGNTIFTEVLPLEVPASVDWIRRDQSDRPLHYSDQTFRARPDFGHPGYLAHMKSVVKRAISDLDPDLIHLDNLTLQPPPATGATSMVDARFRRYLAAKYSPTEIKSRLGISSIEGLTVPRWPATTTGSGDIGVIEDPLVQEWVDFRCEELATFYGEIARFARTLKPDIVIDGNLYGIDGRNNAYLHGVDHARALPHGSAFWSEENESRFSRGRLQTRIRSYKLARMFGQRLFVHVGPKRREIDPGAAAIQAAESLAFNDDVLGHLGQLDSALEVSASLRPYIDFYLKQRAIFKGTRPVGDVAVIRTFESMAFNGQEPHLATLAMEQTLIENKIPFHILIDPAPSDLSRYPVVTLAEQECLSDQSISALLSYLREGGSVFIVGDTGMRDSWRRIRTGDSLRQRLMAEASEVAKVGTSARGSHGRGRFFWISAGGSVDEGQSTPRSGQGVSSAAELAPLLLDGLDFAMRNRRSVRFQRIDRSAAAEATFNAENSMFHLHVVNYDPTRELAENRVSLELGRTAISAEWFDVDRGTATSLEVETSGDRLEIMLPAVKTYGVLVLTLASS